MNNIVKKKQEVVNGLRPIDSRRGLRSKLLIMLIVTLFLVGTVQGVYLTKYVVDLFQQGSNEIIKTSEKELLNITLEEIALNSELLSNTANHFTSHQTMAIKDFPFELYQGKEELLRRTIIEKVDKIRKQYLYTAQILLKKRKQQTETQVKTRIQILKQQQSKDVENLQSSLRLSFLFFLFSLIIILGILQSTWIIKTVIKPILALIEGSHLIEQGHLDHQIAITGDDEIGVLASAFNNMTETLLNSRNTLVSAKNYTTDIISSMLDALIVISPDYRIKTVNPAACTLLGYEENELIGQSIHMILDEENFLHSGIAKLAGKETIREKDISYQNKDGSIIPMLLSGTAMCNQDGELQAIMLVAKDMRDIRTLLKFDTGDANDAAEPGENKYSKLQGLTILLAEDNRFNQILAKEVLEKVGATVRIANNGREAVEMLDKDIDVIMMDIQMPEMDGFEATRIIRSQPEFAAVPIIAMTAHAMSGYKQKCIQAGMDDYVSKPFQPKDVFATLARNISFSPD